MNAKGCPVEGCTSDTFLRPNRAFSGRGCAAREPWRFSGKSASPAGLVGRHRRAADALVGREGEEAEKAVVKPQASGESEHATKREQKARSLAGEGKAG